MSKCPVCKKKMVDHGRTMYAKGCRCEICKEAAKLTMRKYRAEKRGK
jgi:hypothetical protein